jgi:hypothetical protein
MSCGGRRRWWLAPGALVNCGKSGAEEIWAEKLGEAELTVRPRWQQWRLPNWESGVKSSARDEPHDLTARAGRVMVLEVGRRARKGGPWGSG